MDTFNLYLRREKKVTKYINVSPYFARKYSFEYIYKS